MAKGEYDFYILVVCLLILGLQIHNPFESQRGVCNCSCDGAGRPGDASARAGPGTAGRDQPVQPPPVYRRPQAGGPGGSGLSTDALLRELDSIQVKAKEQQDTLTAAGRMPPPSPILQQIKDSEAGLPAQQAQQRYIPQQVPQMPPQMALVPPAVPSAGAAAGAAQLPLMLRRRDDFGRFLQARQPRGLGVVLGVGRGDFALRLLSDWSSAQGVYLIDPYIHIWRGYDDPSNLPDREHQLMFEDLRNKLVPFEGRYQLIRDFSHSFGEGYQRGGQAPATFCYIDANPSEEAVSQDVETWWKLLAPGGILAGGSYTDDGARIRVRTVVDRFAARNAVQVYLTHDDSPPSWFIMKP